MKIIVVHSKTVQCLHIDDINKHRTKKLPNQTKNQMWMCRINY